MYGPWAYPGLWFCADKGFLPLSVQSCIILSYIKTCLKQQATYPEKKRKKSSPYQTSGKSQTKSPAGSARTEPHEHSTVLAVVGQGLLHQVVMALSRVLAGAGSAFRSLGSALIVIPPATHFGMWFPSASIVQCSGTQDVLTSLPSLNPLSKSCYRAGCGSMQGTARANTLQGAWASCAVQHGLLWHAQGQNWSTFLQCNLLTFKKHFCILFLEH